MYNPADMDYTFIKGENMELIELTEAIEDAKASYELAKSNKEAFYYKEILRDLRNEKEKLLRKEFKREC